MTPPQNATSVQHCPRAALRFAARFSTVVVGGIELRGMSTTVVMPPDAAARVPVQKPSQSVRPGSLRCTCALETEDEENKVGNGTMHDGYREKNKVVMKRFHTYSTSPGSRYLSPTSVQWWLSAMSASALPVTCRPSRTSIIFPVLVEIRTVAGLGT